MKKIHTAPHPSTGTRESSKSPWKHAASPPQRPSSTEHAEKEPHLEGPSQTFNASSHSWHISPSRHLSETDDQASFVDPNSTSTPNKTESGPCIQSVSSNSRHSMTPFEMGLGRSFSIPNYAGVHCGSITPVTSVAGSQQVIHCKFCLGKRCQRQPSSSIFHMYSDLHFMFGHWRPVAVTFTRYQK